VPEPVPECAIRDSVQAAEWRKSWRLKQSQASSVHLIRERATRLKRLCDERDRAEGRDTTAYQMLIDRILDEAETFPAVHRVRRPPETSSSANHPAARKKP
jgi:hypothetical protein